MIGVGKSWDDLHYMQCSVTIYANLKPSFDVWHWCLGHPVANHISSISTLDSNVFFQIK